MKTAALAQSVERRSRKAKVSGSIPEGGSIIDLRSKLKNEKLQTLVLN